MDVVETCSVSVVPPLPMQASTDTVVGGVFEGTSFACDGYASDDARLCVWSEEWMCFTAPVHSVLQICNRT